MISFEDLTKSEHQALLVYGNEPYFRTKLIGQLRSTIRKLDGVELTDFWCDDNTRSLDLINVLDRDVMPFGGDDQRVVFLWDFQTVKDRDKKLLPYLSNPAPGVFSIFVLTQGSRAGGDLIKWLKKGLSYESKPLVVDNRQGDELTPWIQAYFRRRRLHVDDSLCHALHIHVGQDLFTLESEMRRILTFCEGRSQALLEDFQACVVPRVYATPIDVINAVIKGDVDTSMKAVHEMYLLHHDDPTRWIVDIMAKAVYRWFKIFYMRKAGKKSFEDIGEKISLNPWVVEKKLWKYLQKWSSSRLLNLLDRMSRAEYLLRRGRMNQLEVELIVLEACGMKLERSSETYPL